MTEPMKEKRGWKRKMLHELAEYWINVLYLSCFFGAFTWYRRLILASYQITYLNYGVAILEALVLAKVILIGDALHLGRRCEKKPLWYSTVYKTFVFTLLVGLFTLVDHWVRGFLQGQNASAILHHLLGPHKFELLARCLVTFVSFIPFFAFKELSRIMGKGKLKAIFFGTRKINLEQFGNLGGASEAPAH